MKIFYFSNLLSHYNISNTELLDILTINDNNNLYLVTVTNYHV